MTSEELDRLAHLDKVASAAPWHMLRADDDMCMSAVLVTKNPSAGRITTSRDYEWQQGEVVAACLVQSPRIVDSDDGLWDEDAELIARVRNALPELVRLARIGLEAETYR